MLYFFPILSVGEKQKEKYLKISNVHEHSIMLMQIIGTNKIRTWNF
jgi:hypothetical protein